MLNVTQALLLIARTEFVPFTQSDWDAFCGCESENPLIGYNGDYCLVLDGDTVNIIGSNDEYGGQLFNLNEI